MIEVKKLSKSFLLPHEKRDTFREKFLGGFRPLEYENFQALSEVSFSVKKGEWLGIMGRNGSGKSTLLKILAGIYTPDEGSARVKGKLIPLLELGVGFHPELTVLQNIKFNATLLGLSAEIVKAKTEAILDFAELAKFKDQKLKNLSSGMQVRLAFAVAIQAEGEVYLLDEVLAVGDFEFQKKCEGVFQDLKERGKTVIMVSHSLSNLERYCDRALVLETGVGTWYADVRMAIDRYTQT